jgi:hypothetical protein
MSACKVAETSSVQLQFCATVSTDRRASARSSSAVSIANRSLPFRSGPPRKPALEAAKMAAQQPHDQEYDQDKPAYPASML